MDKKLLKKGIILVVLTLIFGFFSGYYISYKLTSKDNFSKSDAIKEIMENEWYYGSGIEDINTYFDNKILQSFSEPDIDPFTMYMPSLGSLADSYKGIGISFSRYGDYFIVNDVTSEHAYKCGFRKGDIIKEINSTSVKNYKLNDIRSLIKEGNNDFFIEGKGLINCSSLKYTPITVYGDSSYSDGIAYVRISEFNLDTASKLDDFLKSLDASKDKLIIDLRDNPGGYINTVRDVADLFLPSNEIVLTTKDKHNNLEVVKTLDNGFYPFNKIFIMINENSASGAEALTACLKLNRPELVSVYGSKSYGKGSAQKTASFSDGTYFHFTYALWYMPNNETLNKIGFSPDVLYKRENNGISGVSFYYEEDLKLYDYDENIGYIQEFLKRLSYYDGVVHNFFDEELKTSVMKFQEDNSLEKTGIIDEITISYMEMYRYDDLITFNNNQVQEIVNILK